MIDNKKEEYAHEINRYTKNIIESLIPKRIVPFDYYEERNIDKEVKNWIEKSEGEFAGRRYINYYRLPNLWTIWRACE